MKHTIILTCVAAMAVLTGCARPAADRPAAVRGVMDLENLDIASNGPVELRGEWEIYWDRLLSPGDFQSGRPTPDVEYAIMPEYWNGMKISGRTLSGTGFATHRLTVKLKNPDELYAMKIPLMFTAYRLWINGKPASANGTVGTDENSEISQFLPKMIVVSPDGSSLTILLQISNFHHQWGGMWSSIILGTESQIRSRQKLLTAINFFLLGGFIIMGGYHIGIFSFRRKDRASLYFGLFCLIMALRLVFEGEHVMIEAFPWISWGINLTISYLTLYGLLIIFNLYLYNFFPDIFSRRMATICIIIGMVFCAIIVAVPTRFYFFTRYPFYLNLAFWILYDLLVIVKAVRLKKIGAVFIGGGFAVLTTTAVVDILFFERIIPFGNISGFGVFIVMFSQAMVLSARSSDSFSRIEMLSNEKARLFANSIDIISSILLAHSNKRHEYTRNVARISVTIARASGISDDGIEDIRIAALLHDIGMIGAPDAVLSGKRLGSDADRAIVEHHPKKSIEIIESLKGLDGVKTIIAQHHERYDGSGYPLRLKGEGIAIGARILGLVDDFVAMLGSRDYQMEDKKNRIAEELRRRRGALYDPALVDTLIRIAERDNIIYVIDENDIGFEKTGDDAEWRFPGNVNFELSVVEKVVAEIRSRTAIDDGTAGLIESGLGEVIRNAVIHGNKYDESKQVTVRLSTRSDEGRTVLELRVIDRGEGMDFIEYRHFNESRYKLYEITRELKQYEETLDRDDTKKLINGVNRKLQGFLMEYYINFNKFRQLESPEMTGGIGLIQVMQTFDNVEFRNLMDNNAVSGLEVTLVKYIDT